MKKLLKILIMAMLFAAILQCSAFAETPDAMQAGDIIWMGEWNGEPVSWTILDNEVQNNGEPGMFLFAQYVVSEGGVKYNDAVAEWQNSSAQEWCGEFWQSAFTEAEMAAIPAAYKTTEGRSELFGLYWRPADLTGEHVFFISSEELSQYVGADDGAEGLSGFTADGRCVYYWLRSPHGYHGDYSGLVLQDNQVHDYLVYGYWGGRPAMNLNPEQILYVTPVGDRQWKPAVIDPSMQLEISGLTVSSTAIKANYTCYVTDENAELIMLVYDRAGNISEIRALGAAETSGTISFDSAAELADASKIAFAVRIAGDDRHSDAVSAPAEVKAEVSFKAGEGSGEMAPLGVTPGTPVGMIECGFTAPAGKCFDHWELDGEKLSDSYVIDGNICLTAVYDDIKIRSIDLGMESLTVTLGEKVTLNALVAPENAVNRTLKWSSSNALVAVAKAAGDNSAVVSARYPGFALIKCSSADGCEAMITIEVSGSPVKAFFSNPECLVLAALLAVVLLVLLIKEILPRAMCVLFIVPLLMVGMFVYNYVGGSEPSESVEIIPATPEPTEAPFVEPELESGRIVYFNGKEPAHGTYEKDGMTYIRLSDAAELLESELTVNGDGSLSFPWRKGTVVLRGGDVNAEYLGGTRVLDAEPLLSERGADMYVPVESFCEAIEVGTLYDEELDTLYCTPGRGDWELPQGYNVPVMMYHGTGYASADSNLVVDPSALREQFQYLNDNGFTTLFFDDLWNVDEIEKPIILTFDDGWANNYTDLYPLLQEYNIKATINVVTSLMHGNGIHLPAEQIIEMSESPLVSIQSHTVSHEFLNGYSEEHQRYELSESQLIITRMTKQIPYLIAYPTGACDQTTLDILPDYYRFGMRMYNGYCYNTSDEPGLIYRYYVGRDTWIGEFKTILESIDYGYHEKTSD